jgi:hypothetical protein
MKRIHFMAVLVSFCIAATPSFSQESPVEVSTSTGLTPIAGETSIGFSLGQTVSINRETVATNPALARDLVRETGFRAVNLSVDDLRVDRKALRTYLDQAGVPHVSANVYVGGTGKRVARPYVVLEMAGKKIGVTGVTSNSDLLEGEWEIRDAGKSLADVVSAMEKEADVIILLAWMDRASAAALLRRYPAIGLCLHSGRGVADPDPIAIDGRYLLQGPTKSWHLSRTRFKWSEEGRIREVNQSFEPGPDKVSEELLALYQKSGLLSETWKKVRDGERPDRAATSSHEPLAALSPGKTHWLSLEKSNRAARVRIHSVSLRGEYGNRKASTGTRLAVLDTEWENILPHSVVLGEKIPPSYKIPGMKNHVYLVVNGQSAARIHGGIGRMAGHLSPGTFVLERLGSALRGNLVFEVPQGNLESLELRFYDYAHGHIRFPLLVPGNATPAKAPLVSGENEFMEVAVRNLRRADRLGKETAPDGLSFVIFDLKARCRFTQMVNASAFAGEATRGKKIEAGAIADWRDAHKSITLVVDGKYGYVPAKGTTLPGIPRLLPDILTGGSVAFLAPAKTTSLELVLEFPEARTPGGKAVRPTQIRLLLEGTAPVPVKEEPLALIDDGPFRFAVSGASFPATVFGTKPADGNWFIVLDIAVENVGLEREFFQPEKQVRHFSKNGKQVRPHGATRLGPHYPPALLLIPAGEKRSFQLVFETGRSETKHQFSYAGVTGGRMIELGSGKPGEASRCAKCGTEPQPDDRFCQQCGTRLNR